MIKPSTAERPSQDEGAASAWWRGLRDLLHVHWPAANWCGKVYRYDLCRCQAKRTVRVRQGGFYLPLRPGWPPEGTGWREPS